MNETYLSSQISQHCKNKNHERASYRQAVMILKLKVKVNVDLYAVNTHVFSRDLTVLPAHPAFIL